MDSLTLTSAASQLQAQANVAKQSAAQLQEAKTRAAIKTAAQDFEAMFVSQMLQPVFAELNQDNPFGGGNAEQVYSSLMVQEYGRGIAATGQLQIAPLLEAEMLRQQGLATMSQDQAVEELQTTEGP